MVIDYAKHSLYIVDTSTGAKQMKPADKSPELAQLLDNLSTLVYGRVRRDVIGKDTCVSCGRAATTFKDDISRKEYTLSGMCQLCQDELFG